MDGEAWAPAGWFPSRRVAGGLQRYCAIRYDRCMVKHLGTSEQPLRVAVVGSGPSGFFAAEALFRSDVHVRVDMFDRLPTPYGLVRSGVAPDAQKTKQIGAAFEKTAARDGFAFIGHVTVGRDLSFTEMRRFYDAVIFAYGAEEPRSIGIPGEDLPGSLSASELVGWYNGHPEFAGREVDLSHPGAVIIGNGNVALDVARILSKTEKALAHTDIPETALRGLAASRVRDIYVLGRRGPAQVSFTYTELQELTALEHCALVVCPRDLELNRASREALKDAEHHNARHVLDILQRFAGAGMDSATRQLHLWFYRIPVEIGGDDRVRHIVVERARLEGAPGRQRPVRTGERETIECGLVIRCIGYRGVPIPGVPFDDETGIIPNEEGRVIHEGAPLSGIYVVGWIKHGPVGLIGNTRRESKHVVEKVVEDVPRLRPCPVRDTRALLALLRERGVQFVELEGWRSIDELERSRGKERKKPREKICSMEDLLDAAGG